MSEAAVRLKLYGFIGSILLGVFAIVAKFYVQSYFISRPGNPYYEAYKELEPSLKEGQGLVGAYFGAYFDKYFESGDASADEAIRKVERGIEFLHKRLRLIDAAAGVLLGLIGGIGGFGFVLAYMASYSSTTVMWHVILIAQGENTALPGMFDLVYLLPGFMISFVWVLGLWACTRLVIHALTAWRKWQQGGGGGDSQPANET